MVKKRRIIMNCKINEIEEIQSKKVQTNLIFAE